VEQAEGKTEASSRCAAAGSGNSGRNAGSATSQGMRSPSTPLGAPRISSPVSKSNWPITLCVELGYVESVIESCVPRRARRVITLCAAGRSAPSPVVGPSLSD